MKKLILFVQLIVAGLAICQAAPAPAPSFGGFTKGQTFSFTVRERVSSAVVGATVIPDAAIPSQIPTFQVGQVVKFTIGSKGELKGPRFTIKFLTDAGTSNAYANPPSRTNLNPNQAIVYKNGSGAPSGAFLTFYYTKAGRDGVKLTTVTYALN